MIKKAALIVCTFGVLVGAHLAYTQAFGYLARYLAVEHEDALEFLQPESASLVRSKELARQMFGPESWMARDIKLTYYDASRGSFMYAQEYELKSNGTQMVISPFALVAEAKDRQGHKTVTSERAILTFNQPYSLMPSKGPKEATRVVHAELIGDVRIRDDKGTLEDPKDDLLIGPLTGVEFDEKAMQVTTKSHVLIQDQDIRISGTEMMMQLRRKAPVLPGPGGAPQPAPNGGSGSGFEVETAFLYRNVAIKIANVGAGNILPGQSKPDPQGQVPLFLQCAGQMRIDMPKPKSTEIAGPPNPYAAPAPTYARFERNVVVTRGVGQLDQLNSEMLYLTLSPDRKLAPALDADGVPLPAPGVAVAAAPRVAPAKEGSPMTALKLRTAFATGQAVWVQSESQGMKARCVELKYDKKLEEGQPDRTYLNGGSKRRLWVEKVDLAQEGDKAGTIKEVNRLESVDAEILDYGLGVSKIVALGPGKSESRPSPTASVVRVAWFEDRMMLLTTRDGPKPADGPIDPKPGLAPLRRVITLTGPSKLMDMTSASTLDAKERIVAEFEAGPKPPGSPGGDAPSKIKWLEAYDNVHLATPGKTLTAWRKLDARFLPPEPTAKPVPAPAAAPPVVASSAPAPADGAPAPAEAGLALAEAKPDAPPPPVEGAVDGRANYVYATIQLGGGGTKGEVRDAKLRGGVMVHQEPAPGERFGKNASGEALDLFNQGKGMMKFAVSAEEPQATAPEPRTKLAAGDDAARSRLASSSRPIGPRTLARIDFDGKTIESEHILGLDQAANTAWGKGHGVFHQEADAGLLDEKGLASDPKHPRKPKATGAREKLTITWNDTMNFYGRSWDKAGREVAKVEFRGTSEEVQTPNGKVEFRRGVRALMPDRAISCDMMDVYLDRTVDLSKASKTPAGTRPSAANSAETPEPQAEIAMIEAWGDNILENDEVKFAGVDVTSKKVFDGTQILEKKYRIRHTHVIYDKRTGDFEAAGPGTVFIYEGELPKGVDLATARTLPPSNPTVKLTKVQFTELMQGRFGVSRDGTDGEAQTAEFTGNVQAARAVVIDSIRDLDFDRLGSKPDAVFLTSEALRIRSVSNPRDPKNRNTLLDAERNAAARTVDRLIQADRIKYESATGVMYAYGDDDKNVSLSETKSFGQPSGGTKARTLRYNTQTRQMDLDDPQVIQLFDLKSGIRPKPRYPDLGGSPAKPEIKLPPRARPMRPGRTTTERNGFTGR